MGLLGSLPALAAVIAVFTSGGAVEGLYTGGGLTVLSRNDLDAAQSDGSAANLIDQPSPFESGRKSCAALGEDPWSPEKADFKLTLSKSLGYQEYQRFAPKGQLYWIAKAKDCSCRAIDAEGKIQRVDCGKKLPILCTQGAPVSTSSSQNTSAVWRAQQFVGNKLLTGYRDYHVWKFQGIRYADTPERFTYANVASFEDSGEVDATTAGTPCPQPVGEVQSGTSEDCLFANVWTPYLPRPRDSDKSKLRPVMVYFHGGGFATGSGNNPNTDGTNLASRGDLVVVTVNYRLGSLGFLNFNDGIHDGNYMISDLVAALEWVKKYIKYFGGDPDNVTIFGESAGAEAVHVLLGVAKAKGLFHNAGIQSSPDGWPANGQMMSPPYYASLERNYESTTKTVLDQAGCLNATDDKIACLSKLSGFELVNLPLNAVDLVMDGTYLSNHGLVVNNTGASLATDVTVLMGVNRDELGVYIAPAYYPPSGVNFTTYLDLLGSLAFGAPPGFSALLGLTSPTALQRFPELSPALFDGTATPAQVLNGTVRLATDWLFSCNTFATAYSASAHGAFRRTFFFQFNRTYSPREYTQPWCDAPATADRPHGDPSGDYFRCHGGEQLVVFGNEARAGLPDRDGLDVAFMRLVVDYWAAFARKGDPNPDKGWLEARGYQGTLEEVQRAGQWDAVDAGKPTMRLLQWGGKQVPLGAGHVCNGLGAPLNVFEAK